jgi:gluconate kinase
MVIVELKAALDRPIQEIKKLEKSDTEMAIELLDQIRKDVNEIVDFIFKEEFQELIATKMDRKAKHYLSLAAEEV